MAIRPLHDRVIVKRLEEASTSAGGIILTGSSAEKSSNGEVVAVGNGRVLDNGARQELEVKIGETVLCGYSIENTQKVDGQELLIMKEDNILGVVE